MSQPSEQFREPSRGSHSSRLLNWVAFVLLPLAGAWGLVSLRTLENASLVEVSGLVSLGAVGLWRWSWWLCQVVRSRLYLQGVFPRWRRQARCIPAEELPPVCLLVPTYKEKPWITERVFRVLAQEAQTLSQPMTLLVTSSSLAENDHIRSVLQSVDPELTQIRLIEMVQTGEGKRKAMADGLRKLAAVGLPENTIVALMDGDSELSPGTLRQCLPFFNLFPKMGALTTDELPVVEGSYLFSEWFHLRFAQRHYQMCSVSLSQKIMCLTGRFSLFRGEAALHPTFANILEEDTLDDWLWGHFKFLSGDDKSTWFWLLQRGYDMLYIPDVIVYSIETISGSVMDRAYQNMRRWYGNMLRNSSRAIALGPQKAGWFMWYCLLDQRISFWTSLITPGTLLIFLFRQEWLAMGLVSSWICLSRPLMLWVIFWGRQSHLKLLHLPIFLATQWSSCIVKIWTQMNLAQQKWKNRGNQSISAAGTGWVKVAKLGTSRFLYITQLFCFGLALCWLAGLVSPWQDTADLWWHAQISAAPMASEPQIFQAADHGVVPNDGQDDALALQTLVAQLPQTGPVQINLPAGAIDLFQPITLSRSHLALTGQGSRRTLLTVHPSGAVSPAALMIRPRDEAMAEQPEAGGLTQVSLGQFTISVAAAAPLSPSAAAAAISTIRLEQVQDSRLHHLRVEPTTGYPLVLQNAANIQVDYTLLSQSNGQPPVLMTEVLQADRQVLQVPQKLAQR